MINRNLISAAIPRLHLQDTVYLALQYMADFHLTHLPVVQDEKFVGVVSEESLLDVSDEASPLYRIQESFIPHFTGAGNHIFDTLSKITEYQLSSIAVVETDGNFVGSITQQDLLKQLAVFTGANDKGALIVLSMEKQDFSFSEISRLIETNDAYVTQLNTAHIPGTGEFIVILRINKFEVSDIIATLQRFEYNVKYYFGEERYENELKSNYEHLMNYLNI